MDKDGFVPPLVKRLRTGDDSDYFKSYADLRVHEEMIQDEVRTFTYRQAILRNYENIYGKVVLDVGAGTGILSVFCAHAGAKKVYAIEASNMAEQAKMVVKENKMEGKISVIQGKVEEIDLPEKVDVIVSEWMGYFLLYETMLPSVLHARDKWLKEDGLLFPSEACLYLAPFTDPGDYEDRLSFWAEVENRYKVKMTCLVATAKKHLTHHVQVQPMIGEDVMAHGCAICKLDLKTVDTKDLQNIKSEFSFGCFGRNRIHGFMGWFTVSFPGGCILSTSPYERETHWQQSLFYLDEPVEAEQDTSIKGTITIRPGKIYNRFLDVDLSYSVDDKDPVHKAYVMDGA